MFVTRSGRVITLTEGAPSLEDISNGLFRICRYAGGCSRWWSVGQHSLVVAELCPPGLAIYGLLHDAEESVTGDITRLAKMGNNSFWGDALRNRIFEELGIPQPSPEQWAEVKRSDNDATLAELEVLMPQIDRSLPVGQRLVLSPGCELGDTHPSPEPTQAARSSFRYWLERWTPTECIERDEPRQLFCELFDYYKKFLGAR